MHQEEYPLFGLFSALTTLMGVLNAFVGWKDYLPDGELSLLYGLRKGHSFSFSHTQINRNELG